LLLTSGFCFEVFLDMIEFFSSYEFRFVKRAVVRRRNLLYEKRIVIEVACCDMSVTLTKEKLQVR